MPPTTSPVVRRAAVVPFAALVLTCACNRSPEILLAPVEGVVTHDGKPLAGVQVVFFADGDTIGPQAIGRTDAEGRYTLRLYDGRAGAPVGQHRVCLSDPKRVPPEYSNPATTKLRAEVPVGGARALNFQVP